MPHVARKWTVRHVVPEGSSIAFSDLTVAADSVYEGDATLAFYKGAETDDSREIVAIIPIDKLIIAKRDDA